MNTSYYLIHIWRMKLLNEQEEIDYEKMDKTKDALLKISEEYINEGVKTSAREKVDKIVRLVGKEYDL